MKNTDAQNKAIHAQVGTAKSRALKKAESPKPFRVGMSLKEATARYKKLTTKQALDENPF